MVLRKLETTRLSFLCRCFEDQATDHAWPLIGNFVVARPRYIFIVKRLRRALTRLDQIQISSPAWRNIII